jgi:alkyl hydroperoxide reductase subunit AhpF
MTINVGEIMPEKLLNDQVIDQVLEAFTNLQKPVVILFFGSRQNCDYCDDTHQLIEEVVALDKRLSLNRYDIDADQEVALLYRIDKTPGIVIAAGNGDHIIDYGIQYSGIPSGHEFSTLIQDILLVSGRDSGLNPQSREFLKKLEKPLHLQVFVTPT